MSPADDGEENELGSKDGLETATYRATTAPSRSSALFRRKPNMPYISFEWSGREKNNAMERLQKKGYSRYIVLDAMERLDTKLRPKHLSCYRCLLLPSLLG
jgi:hypothetical protein